MNKKKLEDLTIDEIKEEIKARDNLIKILLKENKELEEFIKVIR